MARYVHWELEANMSLENGRQSKIIITGDWISWKLKEVSNTRLIHFTNLTGFKCWDGVGLKRVCCAFQGRHKPSEVDVCLYHIALPKCIGSLLTYSRRTHLYHEPMCPVCKDSPVKSKQLPFFRRDLASWMYDIRRWQPDFQRHVQVKYSTGNRC